MLIISLICLWALFSFAMSSYVYISGDGKFKKHDVEIALMTLVIVLFLPIIVPYTKYNNHQFKGIK